MVVDDLRDCADSLAMLFQALGHDAEATYDGHQALDRARGFRPDVVFLDVNMPQLDGYGTAEALRAQAEGPPPMLIALSAASGVEARRRAGEAGFDLWLSKPAELGMLMAILDAMERRNHRHAAPRARP